MLTNWLLCLSLLLPTSTRIGALEIQPRIYGGQKTFTGDIGGFGVQIFYITKLVCTGTLISPRHLITAAHCFESMNQSNFHVIAGMTREFKDNGQSSQKNRLVEVRLHPKFQKKKFIADIAVAKTQLALKSPSIGYAEICSVRLFDGDMVTVAGWGTSGEPSDQGKGNTLRMMRIPIVNQENCEKKMGRKMPVNILCASGYDHKTLCSGDSGGPLIFRGEVCGVSTWTWQCGDNQKPDVFMSVRYYADFIKSTVQTMGY